MSLSHATVGGGGGVQPFSLPPPMPSHSHSSGSSGGGCNDGCCGPSGPDLSMMTSSSQGKFRGEMSGSQCLSVELGEDKMAAAVWSEQQFMTSTLRDAISTAVSINREGNRGVLELLDTPSLKAFDALKGVAFGSAAEAKNSKGNDEVDVLYPTRYLGRENNPSECSLLSIVRDPSTSFSRTQAFRLPLTHSSDGDAVSLHPEELVALQLQYWASKALSKQQSDERKSGEGNKKNKKQKRDKNLTLVVPGYFGQRERNVAKAAAQVAGLDLQHVFSRGLCATAASLFGSQTSDAFGVLQNWTKKQNNPKNPVVLFVHVNTHGLEVSLIECQEPNEHINSTPSKKGSGVNVMFYDRLVCIASGGMSGEFEGISGGSVMKQSNASASYPKSVVAILPQVMRQQLDLGGILPSDISLVLLSGQGSSQSFRDILSLQPTLDSICSVPVLPVPEEDPARGGSILAAAELDSSKQYIDLEDDHSILVHCLSIAEDVLGTSIGMLYIESSEIEESFLKDEKKLEDSIQCLYPSGTVIRKADVGPVRKQVNIATVDSKEFQDGYVNFFGSHNSSYEEVSYPKILLVQHEPMVSSIRDEKITNRFHWRPVTDVGFPLLSDNGKALLKSIRKASKDGTSTKKHSQMKQSLLSCKVNFKMNESLGLVTLEHAQGEKVSDKVKAKSQVAKIVYVFFFLAMLVFAYYAYGIYSDMEEHRMDTVWLTEFYEKHAPKKLDDPNLVEDTLARYKGKLFLLWRKLEKAYDVKIPPPQRILDSNSEL